MQVTGSREFADDKVRVTARSAERFLEHAPTNDDEIGVLINGDSV